MQVPALLLLILPALLPRAISADPGQPCPSEMNKVKDILEVNCTEQGLSAVPSDLPEETGILLLSANNLTSLSIAAFLPLTQLQDLDLSENGMVALQTGPPLPSLKELILSHNMLQDLPTLKGLPALTRLAVAYNSLAVLAPGAFQAVPQLQDLDLRGNKLRTLPQEVFVGLRALRDLDLSDNLLEELPKELLQDLHNLETLWLSGNRLQTLPTDFFLEGHIFMYVFLTENPWHCDCELRYLRLWILQNEDSVYQPERGLEKTKVEVAPDKVLCHSPAMHQQKPIISFKPSCGNVGDADEEEEDENDFEEIGAFHPHPSTSEKHSTIPHAVTWPPFITTKPPLSTPCSSTLTPSTLLAMPTSTRAASTTTSAPSTPPTPTQTLHATGSPSTAPISTSHAPTSLISTTPLPTTMSTTSPATSTHPQTVLATSTTNTSATLMMSTGTFSTTSTSVPSTARPEASSVVRSSSPLTSATLVVSTTILSAHAPTPSTPLDTTRFTQSASSPPPAPLPLCPCSIPVPALRSQAGGEGPQWGQWVLRHCCLLHWVVYLTSLVLLVLILLCLAGCLAWLCLVGRSSWHKSLQIQEVQYPLLKRRESMGSPVTHLSSFKSSLQCTTFCTIKEIDLCPEVTYCTIKDLGIQHNPPVSSSYCTTKELWVHRSPPNASFNSFSTKLMVTNLRSLRTPSSYSLDRGVKAIGEVRVKYASNTL